jgi:hypothetical protein
MVSAFASPPTAQRFELVGALGGGPMLLLALLVWRRRNSGH